MASIVYATQRRYLPSSDDINLEADKRDNQHFRKLCILLLVLKLNKIGDPNLFLPQKTWLNS